jgi:hypothetical protein
MGVNVAQIIAQNRLNKAMKLADILELRGFTLDQVRQMTDHGWHITAASAGTNPPSKDTQELVLQILEKRGL